MSAQLKTWFLGQSRPVQTVKAVRDPRIDAIRGLALLMIFINHMPGNPFSALTIANFLFNDAAEVFVLLAGYSSMLAYHRGFEKGSVVQAALPILLRARKLFVVQLLLTIAMLLLATWLTLVTRNASYLIHLGLNPERPLSLLDVSGALLLQFQLSYVDILPLYVVLLMATPLLIITIRKSPWLTLALSVGVYLTALQSGLNLPLRNDGEWFFNPFSWQLIFVIGLLAGHATLREVTLPRSRVLVVVATVFLAFSVTQKAPWAALGLGGPLSINLPFDLNYGAKTYAAPGRLISLLAVAYLVAALMPRDLALLSTAAGRMLQDAGRNSLPVFIAGTVLSLVGMAIISTSGSPFAASALATVIGGGLMLATPFLLERSKDWLVAVQNSIGHIHMSPGQRLTH